MKVRINKSDLSGLSIIQFMRQLGYYSLPNRFNNDISFVRRLSRDFYPRFHIYIKNETDEYIFNLHLDQKKASYVGQKAHSGEYDGDLVENEARRIKSSLLNSNNNFDLKAESDNKKEKKTFWSKLFN